MDLLCEPLSPPPPSGVGDMRTDSERALRMTHRKFNKHMAEKRRRARINQALEQMKTMVLSGMQKDPEHYDKMEKADILDLTVKYVTTVVAESPELSAALTTGKKFRAGFEECLKEVDSFLNTVAMETSAKTRLVGHLSTQAQTQSASAVLARLEGERLTAYEDQRRREVAATLPQPGVNIGGMSVHASRQASRTAIVAPVHVVAPHAHSISRVGAPHPLPSQSAAVSAGSAADDSFRGLEARLKPEVGGQQGHYADVACLPPPPLPPHLLAAHAAAAHAAGGHMVRPVPLDLRHKYFQVAADRCVPVPLYDSMWRPWGGVDRPVSV